MIDVFISKDAGHYQSYRVEGHAEYAPRGHDIVCAAVSALTCILEAAINEFADTEDRYDLLLDAYKIGIEGIEEEYPEYVRLHLET